MRFLTYRTTQYGGEDRPCERATKGEYTRVDVRGWPSHDAITNERVKEDWLIRGKNHRVIQVDGRDMIARDFDDSGWFVELEYLEDLMDFIIEFGQVVVGVEYGNIPIPTLEIYDGWRE